MTFESARKRLKKIAGDKYCSTSFEVSEYGDKKEVAGISCKVYIAGIGWYMGNTWEAAFNALADAMHGDIESSMEEQGPKGDN